MCPRHPIYPTLVYDYLSSCLFSQSCSTYAIRPLVWAKRGKNRRLCDLTDGDTPHAGAPARGHFSSGFSSSFLPTKKLRGWLAPSSRRAISRIMLARLLNVLMVAVASGERASRNRGIRNDQGYRLRDKRPNCESHDCYTCQK